MVINGPFREIIERALVALVQDMQSERPLRAASWNGGALVFIVLDREDEPLLPLEVINGQFRINYREGVSCLGGGRRI